MIALSTIGGLAWGSKTAKIVTVSAAVFLGFWAYGTYKEWKGGRTVAAKIIVKSNKVAKRRHKSARKVRRNIKPSDARKRLQSFARTPGD